MKLIATVVFPLSVGTLFGQRDFASHSCKFNEVVNRAGWEVPGVEGAAIAKHARYNSPESNGLVVAVLTPKDSLAAQVVIGQEGVGRLTYRLQPIEIQELWRYEKKGRVFAYRVRAIWMGGEGSTRYPLATATTLLFYDSTGNGKFDVMRYSDSDMPFKLIVPEWVDKLDQAGGPRKPA